MILIKKTDLIHFKTSFQSRKFLRMHSSLTHKEIEDFYHFTG